MLRLIALNDLCPFLSYNVDFHCVIFTAITETPVGICFLWLDKKGWPNGELGGLLALSLALKIEGLDSVVKPLKRI